MVLTNAEVAAILPHRGTMLLVDRVTDGEPGVWLTAEHDVTADAHWVIGHFPGQPVMPGVLVVEALGQTAALVALTGNPEQQNHSLYLVGLNRIKFRRPVVPTETLCLRAEVSATRRGFVSFKVSATVNGERVADGELLATVGSALRSE